jgi:nicotinate phosphoribosyltransferase
LLVDTYDTVEGVKKVIRLARELGAGFRVRGIRLDSGDIGALANEARRMLNEAGLTNVQIFASGGIDEYSIDELLRAGAPTDGFGVGTHMGTSADAPFLDAAYKLVEYAGSPRIKLSTSKVLLPGRKQVFREFAGGVATQDVIALFDENLTGTPLLKPVMLNGRRVGPAPTLEESRSLCRENIRSLPPSILGVESAAQPYPVRISPRLAALEAECKKQVQKQA